MARANLPRRRARFGKFSVLFAVAASLALVSAHAAAQDAPPQGFIVDDAQPGRPPPPPPGAQVQASATVSVQASTTDEFTDTDPRALSDFHAPLTAYGTWVVDATYGTVWVPNATVVGADFAPYQTAGRWAMTDEGDWLWVSDYEWGHIPFHYGRWVWVSGRGWAWIPGRVYAPAWVVWRTGDYGYIGWAPMPPAYYWSGGVAVSLWVTPRAAYVFCPSVHVFHRHVHHHIVRDRTIVHRIAYHSRPYRPAAPSHARSYKPGSPSPAGASGNARPPGGEFKEAHPAPSGHHAARPASPSLTEAKIPASAVPTTRVKHDARAVAWARPSTTAHVQRSAPSARSLPAAQHADRGPSRAVGSASHGEHPSSRATPSDSGRFPQAAPAARSTHPSAQASGQSPAAQLVSPKPARRSSDSEASEAKSSAPAAQRPSVHSSTPSVRPSPPARSVPRSAPAKSSSSPSKGSSSHAPSVRPGRR